MKSPEEKFWSKVDTSGDCWEWLACKNPQGYGRFWFRSRQWRAHRVAWFLEKGEIPEGIHILHKCDNPPCVRIDHLYLGTDDDNNKDMMEKGRFVDHHVNKTHCPYGHPYSGTNLYVTPDGKHRQCKTCSRENTNKYRELDRENVLKKEREYREKNKERIKKRWHEYYQKNKERIKEYRREQYRKNKLEKEIK